MLPIVEIQATVRKIAINVDTDCRQIQIQIQNYNSKTPIKQIKCPPLYKAFHVLKDPIIKKKVLTSKYVDILQQTVVTETPAGV